MFKVNEQKFDDMYLMTVIMSRDNLLQYSVSENEHAAQSAKFEKEIIHLLKTTKRNNMSLFAWPHHQHLYLYAGMQSQQCSKRFYKSCKMCIYLTASKNNNMQTNKQKQNNNNNKTHKQTKKV